MELNSNRLNMIYRYLLTVFFTGLLLYFGQTLFIPLLFGLLIAVVMYPLCKWLEQKHWSRTLAISLSLSIVIILFGLLIWLLLYQVQLFRTDLPAIELRLGQAFNDLQEWLLVKFNIEKQQQEEWLKGSLKNLANNLAAWFQGSIRAIFNGLLVLFIIPVFAALFLYNRETFMRFLVRMAGEKNRISLYNIARETVHTYSRFIKGMVLVYLIVGILNSLGLWALGVDHALLFGMLCAIMTIVPYVGVVVSALLPISMAWISTGDIWVPLGIVAVFSFVQYLEANVIFPKVVGYQIHVNTWSTLVAILAGGIIWGVSGMILFIPFVAIFKILADNIPGMEAWSILLGDPEQKKKQVVKKHT